MGVYSKELQFNSSRDFDMIEITSDVQKVIEDSSYKEGIVNIFVIGSTASVSTIEYEPNLVEDMRVAVERFAPSNANYKHHQTWGDDNGKSHVRATILGPGIVVPFNNGRLVLGTWQQIVVLDFDVPARKRRIHLTIIGE